MNEKQITRHVGSTFLDHEYGLVVVVESDNCEGCVYDKGVWICAKDKEIAGSCTGPGRNDGKCVKFIPCALETRPIGSVFTDPIFGQLKVVESEECDNCVYYSREDREDVGYCIKSIKTGFCGPKRRTDKKPVIFIKYKENE